MVEDTLIRLNRLDHLISFDTKDERDRVWDMNKYPIRYSKLDSSTIDCMYRGHIDSISNVMAEQILIHIEIKKKIYYVDYSKPWILPDNERAKDLVEDVISDMLLDPIASFKSACKKPYFLVYKNLFLTYLD